MSRAVIAWAAAIVIFVLGWSVVEAAVVTEPAERLQPQMQVVPMRPPPPTPREVVNSLPYALHVEWPAKQAWYIITAEHGWSKQRQDSWWPFSSDVMYGESGYCPNRLRGDVMVYPPDGCRQVKQGYGSDAGFAQLISVHYGPGMWLCVEHGICSKWTIISEPWISMEVFIWLLERQGSQPWCYNASARRYHDCWLAPDR